MHYLRGKKKRIGSHAPFSGNPALKPAMCVFEGAFFENLHKVRFWYVKVNFSVGELLSLASLI